MLSLNKIIVPITTILAVGCATGPTGKSFEDPIGVWNEKWEREIGKMYSAEFTIIDETRGIYTGSSRVEFYEIDEQGRWKGYWINNESESSVACSEKKGGSPFWGESIYRFNDSYNRYSGTWDYCGEGQKYVTAGTRKK